MIKFTACLLLIYPLMIRAQVFTIHEEMIDEKQALTEESLSVFEDTSVSMTIHDIIDYKFQGVFSPYAPKAKYGKASNIWLRGSITNNSSLPRDLVISFNDWDVSIWSLSEDQISFQGRQGILSSPSRLNYYLGENIGTRLVKQLLPGDTITYYVKSPGFLKKTAFFIAVQDLKSMDGQIKRDLWAIGIFSGCFFFICLATFFLFIKSLKWRSIFYAIYAIGGYLFFAGYYGIDFFLPLEWPFSYTLFLPFSSLFYLLFVYHFLELYRVKIQGKIFSIYITLLGVSILVLIYALIANHEVYYHFLRNVNRVNIWFTIFSLLVITRVPGKPKYFVFGGVFFLFLGGLIYIYIKELRAENHSFIYPMMGFMFEMVTFLIGNFYVLNLEHKSSIQALHEKEKELVKKKEELKRFTAIVKEKNKVIDSFQKDNEHQKHTLNAQLSYDNTITSLMQATILTSDEWVEFRKLFSQVYPGFLGKIRNKFPELTETDERLFALTKLNLSNKEISLMLGISTDSVYKIRYRLSKKLDVPSEAIETIVAEL